MAITFNADEIFEMAEEIERNGAAFYREAAAKASREDIKKMLLDLAAMEEGHEQTFAQMRKKLSP
ncbi:MAG TPA: ferritin family protein, partial [Anaerohalosphaeraceae bacterium]|nr:ferritin family protein [Anaerohalosphaeraceae bacterium]